MYDTVPVTTTNATEQTQLLTTLDPLMDAANQARIDYITTLAGYANLDIEREARIRSSE